jgi:hypothetical protein
VADVLLSELGEALRLENHTLLLVNDGTFCQMSYEKL